MIRDLQPGDRLDRFQVVSLLGVGGIARVYRVRHLALGTEHALKILVDYRPDLLDRMLQEGRVQARIRNPNVVAVSDVVDDGDMLGLVMEYVHGRSLETRLSDDGPIPVAEGRALFSQMLDGVRAAHEAGALHRDLKPANILLAHEGDAALAKITDFGIAKVVGDYGGRLGRTRARVMMGTPGYVAPEQWADSASVDARADIFSLGVIFYEMLAGSLPYRGMTPTEVYRASLSGEHPLLSDIVPDVPVYVARAVERAIRPEPDDRFSTVVELAEALSPPVPVVPPAPAAGTYSGVTDPHGLPIGSDLSKAQTRMFLRDPTGRPVMMIEDEEDDTSDVQPVATDPSREGLGEATAEESPVRPPPPSEDPTAPFPSPSARAEPAPTRGWLHIALAGLGFGVVLAMVAGLAALAVFALSSHDVVELPFGEQGE